MDTEELIDLDDSWILHFENTEEEYKYFYKENIQSIKLRYMYINNDNVLEKIKEETILLKKANVLSREEIVMLINNNNKINNTTYSVLSLLKYNIDLEPYNLKTFLKKSPSVPNYLTNIKNIEDIYFLPTIYMFQDLNDIILLFYEKQGHTTNKNVTKKIFIKQNTSSHSHSHKNKTYKKRLK